MEPLLPSVERARLAQRMYVDFRAMRPHLERAVRRGAVRAHVPSSLVLEGIAAVPWESESDLRASAHAFVDVALGHMRHTFQLLHRAAEEGQVYSLAAVPGLWDEAVALVLETLLDGFSLVGFRAPSATATDASARRRSARARQRAGPGCLWTWPRS